MFYIARIPRTENPANPSFHEFLSGGGGAPYVWTPSPSEAMRFNNKALADMSLANVPQKIRAGAFIKSGSGLVGAPVKIKRINADR